MNVMAISKPKENQDTIKLFDLGTLVNLRIGGWSGRKILTRNDLVQVGYDPDNLPSDIINLGRKLLVPKSELQTINKVEQKARKILEKWSVPFGISSSHFVPANMVPTIEQQIKELREEFFELVDSFIFRFDDLAKAVKESHPDFWDKCLRGHYPRNPKALRDKFRFDLYFFRVSGIGSIEETNPEEVIAKQKVQNEREVELRKQMQDEVGKFVEEYVTSMREETVRFCDLMTARVNGKPYGDEDGEKQLTPRSIACFRKQIDKFREMNIFGDTEIEKMLDEFKRTFLDHGVSPGDFESANIQSGVTKALKAIRDKAAAEGENCGAFIGELKRKIVI